MSCLTLQRGFQLREVSGIRTREVVQMSILITMTLVVGGFWLLVKALPIIGRFLLYCVIAIPAWIFLFFVPGVLDESGLLIFLLFLAVARSGESGFSNSNIFGSRSSGYSYSDSDYSSGSSYSSYVLNKRTGVIHRRWDDSADTISSHNQRAITSSEAWDLVNRGTRYRFKQDP